jgi:undecaprenol kinase
MKNQPFHVRLGFAFAGIADAFRTENGFRLQVLATCAVLVVLCVTAPPAIWWAIAAITVSTVTAAELFNTALEHLADHLHPQEHARIKIVKDCAAGAVLLTSIGSLCVAVAFLFAVVL